MWVPSATGERDEAGAQNQTRVSESKWLQRRVNSLRGLKEATDRAEWGWELFPGRSLRPGLLRAGRDAARKAASLGEVQREHRASICVLARTHPAGSGRTVKRGTLKCGFAHYVQKARRL